MQTNSRKAASNKFPLRLMPSVRKGAEQFSQREGVSLNQFINVAIAEKIFIWNTMSGLPAVRSPLLPAYLVRLKF